MRSLWQDFADLVLPADCAGCGARRTLLCEVCRSVLYGRRASRVRPAPAPSGLPVVHAVAPYRDEVRAVLLAHKERGALGLAAPLGRALAESVRAALPGVAGGGPALPRGQWGERACEGTGGAAGARECGLCAVGARCDGRAGCAVGAGCVGWARGAAGVVGRGGGGAPAQPCVLVPLPSAPASLRSRGHHPTHRMALAAARALRASGIAVRVLPVLRQRRAVADQAGLNSRERQANLHGALEVNASGLSFFAGQKQLLSRQSRTRHGEVPSRSSARPTATLRETARRREDAHEYECGYDSRPTPVPSPDFAAPDNECRIHAPANAAWRNPVSCSRTALRSVPGTDFGADPRTNPRANPCGNFGSGRSPGPVVIIVDDLLTTGASIAEAARALSADAGVERIASAVVAAPPDAFGPHRYGARA